MLSETEKKQVMRWIWDQMHRSDVKLAPDQLIFEGEHDLAYLYNCGFVDTDRYSYDKWLNAFRPHLQKDGSYRLSLEEWLSKTPYRYFGPIEAPFDPMTMREGEWTLEDYKAYCKQHILPEITLTYGDFLQGLEQAKQNGTITGQVLQINRAEKEKLVALMDQYATPKRRRARDAEQTRQQTEGELELPQSTSTPASRNTRTAPTPGEKSAYRSGPQQSKQTSGKLTDLLSGTKKR